MGTELTGKTLGLGRNIGSIVARKAIGIGLKVLALTRSCPKSAPRIWG